MRLCDAHMAFLRKSRDLANFPLHSQQHPVQPGLERVELCLQASLRGEPNRSGEEVRKALLQLVCWLGWLQWKWKHEETRRHTCQGVNLEALVGQVSSLSLVQWVNQRHPFVLPGLLTG